MTAFLPYKSVTVEHFHVMRLYLSHIGHKDIKSFLLGQHRSTYSALGGTQYYHSFPHNIRFILFSM